MKLKIKQMLKKSYRIVFDIYKVKDVSENNLEIWKIPTNTVLPKKQNKYVFFPLLHC
jgi:hypothetical protein